MLKLKIVLLMAHHGETSHFRVVPTDQSIADKTMITFLRMNRIYTIVLYTLQICWLRNVQSFIDVL